MEKSITFKFHQSFNGIIQLVIIFILSLTATNLANAQCDAIGGLIEGGPFEFCVDGTPDNVSGITLNGNEGELSQWVITDAEGNILGLPPMPGVVNFDEAGAGVCLIWHLSYADGLTGLEGGNNVSDLDGCYALSNSITVVRGESGGACEANCDNAGGVLEGGPFEFCVDGTSDFVSGITLSENSGTNNQWVITDAAGNILGLPPMPGVVDFDGAGAGVCLIWNVSYEDGLAGLEADGNIFTGLDGCYGISNTITVTRNESNGGTITGGPFEFCVDGTPDNVSGITLDGNDGPNSQWVITDAEGNILGLPPMPGVVNFDEAGAGVCLIWHLSYADGLTGLEGGNNVSDLDGCYGLSNSITVVRGESGAACDTNCDNTGGVLEGGPFEFCVDGSSDFVSGITLSDNSGTNNQWVVTDAAGNILGLPPMPGVVDFDGAGAGVCLIWNVSYEDGLTGLEADGNIFTGLDGCYGISNTITVTRNGSNGGTITGGTFEFCVDGTPDNVSGITLDGNDGANSQWVITDAEGNILGLPPMPGVVDFDGAGAGVCLIWHLSYADGLTGLEGGNNVSDLEGCYGFSNSITVVRSESGAACDAACENTGGVLEGGPFEFCVDGIADNVSGITLNGNSGTNNQWVITDAEGNILGLPPMPGVVDFDEAGAGVCLIWNVSYEDGLTGLEADGNIFTGLDGCYGISNTITVTRNGSNGGTIAGGPFEFCVDGIPDFVSGITLDGNDGPNSQWVITDPDGNILGLPPMPGVVDFDGAGAGVCLIWHLSYADGLTGLEAGNNVDQLDGCYGLSNSITVTRKAAIGGIIEGGPFEFCVDGTPDFVSGITLSGNEGDQSQWVITDTIGTILGLPPMPGVVDFDEAGVGVCLIWNLSFNEGLEGAVVGNNVSELSGCYGLSNSITVTRVDEGPTCISSTDDPNAFSNVVISPNPASEYVNLSYEVSSSSSQGEILLYDLQGKVISRNIINNERGNIQIPVRHISPGTYIVRLRFGNDSIASKIVVMH